MNHLLGRPIPEPSGNYYGLTTITHPEKDQPKLKILDPYSTFTLHTDGIFADNPVDWILMGKMYEKNAVGGESRLLHISDFDLFETFESEPIKNTIFDFGLSDIDKRHDIFAQVSNLVPGQSRLLYQNGKDKMVKFVDQFILPKTLEQAHLIERLQNALETSESIVEVYMPVGACVVLNNRVWMHGRSPFQKNLGLERQLFRSYGLFQCA